MCVFSAEEETSQSQHNSRDSGLLSRTCRARSFMNVEGWSCSQAQKPTRQVTGPSQFLESPVQLLWTVGGSTCRKPCRHRTACKQGKSPGRQGRFNPGPSRWEANRYCALRPPPPSEILKVEISSANLL